jgi:hypothetical protein
VYLTLVWPDLEILQFLPVLPVIHIPGQDMSRQSERLSEEARRSCVPEYPCYLWAGRSELAAGGGSSDVLAKAESSVSSAWCWEVGSGEA